MKDILLKVLVIAYACVGIVALVGYIPTIKDLWFRKMSANMSSYMIWTASTLVTFLYSLFILPDTLFRVVSGINFACCAAVLILGFRIKYSKKRK